MFLREDGNLENDWTTRSSREYFEIWQNLSLTKVMVPLVLVVATIADASSANSLAKCNSIGRSHLV
jgi:choline-glycine betaine transporter